MLFRKLHVCVGNTISRAANADKAPMEILMEHETNSIKKRSKNSFRWKNTCEAYASKLNIKPSHLKILRLKTHGGVMVTYELVFFQHTRPPITPPALQPFTGHLKLLEFVGRLTVVQNTRTSCRNPPSVFPERAIWQTPSLQQQNWYTGNFKDV